jgi:hypothetical protein
MSPAVAAVFTRGDTNGDDTVDLSDGVNVVSYLFRDLPARECLDAYDVNDDGNLDIADAVWLISYVFRHGAEPRAPFPAPGLDPTPTDQFSCGDGDPAMSARYVRAGAQGSGTGTDWRNAYRALPAALTRGYTYYVADGNYADYNFDDAESGSAVITLKKATAGEHGTDEGWAPAYGLGTARFTGLSFATGHYVIDGAVGTPGQEAYGFEVYDSSPTDTLVWLISMEQGVSAIDLRYIEAHRPTKAYRGHSLYAARGENSAITVSRCYFHDLHGVHFYFIRADNVMIDRCTMARNQSTPEIHSESIQARGTTNMTVRYSWFEDIEGTAVIISGSGDSAYWTIHGNVFCATPGFGHGNGHGTIADNLQDSIHHVKVYNNTFVNIRSSKCGVRFYNGTGSCEAYNNLYENCIGVGYVNTTHDYDTYAASAFTIPEFVRAANDVVTASPFLIDAAGGDYRLGLPTAPGLRLGSPFDRDMLGVLRGADGVWDRGAFEFRAP